MYNISCRIDADTVEEMLEAIEKARRITNCISAYVYNDDVKGKAKISEAPANEAAKPDETETAEHAPATQPEPTKEEVPKEEPVKPAAKKKKTEDPWDAENPDVNACKVEMRARLSKLNTECGSDRLRDVLLKFCSTARFPDIELKDYPALAEEVRKVMRYA